MSVIKNYSSLVFANLHEFEIAKKKVTKNEKHLDQLGGLIKKYKLENLVGITLLHKHFNLYEGEKLVRKYSASEFKIGPFTTDDTNIIPYAFAYSKTAIDSELELYPIEFIVADGEAELYKNHYKELLNQEEFIVEFKNYLQLNEINEVFGLAFLPYHLIKLKPGEILLERDDKTELESDDKKEIRWLSIKAIKESEMIGNNRSKTYWDLMHNGGGHTECMHHCDH
ncbi:MULTISPECIES: hypothetical protein [Paenibacillus]|uniref:hypothetical protein n=1 Tax=Paenibacillus TaxID=44249 RepID=UPI0004188C97|nr:MULTISPECIES: hypothetical protein [Paenibacillus]KGP78118.1 hypothetical protein P364_0130150 [Paenibacillus sp. MAEPY2]KGP89360.1 hypothetical protein P363_0101500 [Paenibacillus sp. MAEPY1]OZQ71090.1 hypothetical protein CA599_11185 [Paenibacillus taichungensis]